ncbi:nuclear transport factor 2 family protein [Terrimonas sp. NA20]|uniref:Nuclear transport factor 2 family protein n=1 Tax=Terrimonas ginsenosidimutans TaxID=2908004 RepID=A0ABS9KMB9_9BACT|nr:nuclear transport factor 2 family protein [Terrimonas ginsenosidimutans]MCG2613454.1 nuclear transport factor 2 family protein [Terrimonas ginsenosidimutans]
MKIKALITEWIAAANAFDTKKYLGFYSSDAILEDPSVGRSFNGHKGIREYFESYFIGYNTHTRIIKLDLTGDTTAHLQVAFTGSFPEGHIHGTFDFQFKNDKISYVKAALIH